ncbi:tail fiber assembly protein [Govanella unica]|uniref:Phage tail assembly chaperone n=1 Tax=Govanella unica TaxID=2975056 RepID=A0A9X3Z6A6_9PROT|nr:tail fiber assembly protein [Govania unica]MDA5192798.1 phage tail assembly chaperone [Govania unica]
MLVYNYHPMTGEYLSTAKADPDPLEKGNWLIPAHATTEKPPSRRGKKVAVYHDGWALCEDTRGQTYWLPDGSRHEIQTLGQALPDGALTTDPSLVQSAAQQLAALRHTRNTRLSASDWTQMPDAPLIEARRAAWQDYRQALRDLPEIWADNPGGVLWPEPPAASII